MKSTYKIILLMAFLVMNAMSMPLSAQDIDSNKHLPVSTTSDEAKAFYHEANRLLSHIRTNEALQKLDEAIKADPTFFMAIALKAMTQLFDTNKSPVDFETALAIPQESLTPAEQIFRKMLVKVKVNKDSESKPDISSLCEELVSTYPTNIEAHFLASEIVRFVDDNEELATRYVEKIIELDPNYGPAHNIMGYHWMDKGDLVKAKQALDNYLRLNPDEANAHDSMGDYYMKAGDYDKSAEHFQHAFAMGMDVSRERAEKARALAAGEEPKDIPEDDPEDE